MPVALLLEDEVFIAIDIEQAFRDAGVDVYWFRLCSEAVAWLADNQPDVAIVDIKLADGVCTEIVEELSDRDIPFLVHSGSDPDGKSHSLLSGVWFTKPADITAMVQIATSLSSARSPKGSMH